MKANYGHLSYEGKEGSFEVIATQSERGERVVLSKGLTQEGAINQIERINAILSEE